MKLTETKLRKIIREEADVVDGQRIAGIIKAALDEIESYGVPEVYEPIVDRLSDLLIDLNGLVDLARRATR